MGLLTSEYKTPSTAFFVDSSSEGLSTVGVTGSGGCDVSGGASRVGLVGEPSIGAPFSTVFSGSCMSQKYGYEYRRLLQRSVGVQWAEVDEGKLFLCKDGVEAGTCVSDVAAQPVWLSASWICSNSSPRVYHIQLRNIE